MQHMRLVHHNNFTLTATGHDLFLQSRLRFCHDCHDNPTDMVCASCFDWDAVTSGAWSLVELRGEARVLVPRLVTGLKIWHMRQAGIFYPKHSFLTTMANLPDGAQVSPCNALLGTQ